MIQITRHELHYRIPVKYDGLKVVQLTDFHRGRQTRDSLLVDAVRAANSERPDIILLTGDYVTNDASDIGPCAAILESLKAPLGVYAILGNHDYYTRGRAVECALLEIGFHVLLNRAVKLDSGIWIVGLDDDRYHRTDVQKAFNHVPADSPALVMAHNPALIESVSDRDCFVFSGHTHGGQIKLPFLTSREIRRIGAKHYRAGWYKFGNARVYVNQGLGSVGVPIRLFCPPEVAVFTLRAGPKSAVAGEHFNKSGVQNQGGTI